MGLTRNRVTMKGDWLGDSQCSVDAVLGVNS